MTENTKEVATLGGGCFWCVEAVFNQMIGVESAISGYAGGANPNPTYQQVCSGTTGHAEVVEVTYDSSVNSYKDILEVFFAVHDPTTPNRQGADIGTQYRSVIYYHSDEQKRIAEELIAELERDGIWNGVVTELSPAPEFFPAEDYHQNYLQNNPTQGYCQVVVAPKVAKFRQKFASKLKTQTATA